MPKNIEKELDASTKTVYSVDSQIDKYFVSFEKTSVAPTDIEESNHENLRRNAFRELIREMLLIEQDEDKEEEEDLDVDKLLGDAGDEPAGDEGGDIGGDEGGDMGDMEDMGDMGDLGGDEDFGGPTGGGGGGKLGFDEEGGDEGAPDEGEEEKKEEEEKIDRKPMLNIENFSANVFRLIENYENLLNIKDAIINRAVKYIEQNYDDDTAFMIKQALKYNYDV